MISKDLAKKIAAYSVMAETFLLCHERADAQIMYTDVNPDLIISNSFFNLDVCGRIKTYPTSGWRFNG